MTLEYVKSELFNLGFEKEQKYKDDKNILMQALNRAMSTITTEVRPIIGELILPSGSGVCDRFDLMELTKENGEEKYLQLLSVEKQNGELVSGYLLQQRNTLIFNNFSDYPVSVFYKKAFSPFSITTPDSTKIKLDSDVCVLLPLLAAYYVWLDDDDGRKSVMYYNDYEAKRNAILSRDSGTVATVTGGVVI